MKMSTMKANAGALDGEWMGNLDGFGDFEVKIRSLDCPQADAYTQKLFRVILGRRATRRDKDLPPAVRDYVYARTLIDICVTDWRNWQDDDGNEVPYNPAELEAFLLKDAPEGIKVGARVYRTPDGKAYNFEGKFLYNELLAKAQAVDVRDEDEDEDGVDAEKNESSAGSAGAADSASA